MSAIESKRIRALRRRVVGDAVTVTLFAARMTLLGLGLLLQRRDHSRPSPR